MMISPHDLYNVLCSTVPLYVAMLAAYVSVRRYKVFTAEQCSGVNRFVATFAVPVLSFHFISQNDPYKMDGKFILADTLSKLFVLSALSLWGCFMRNGSLDWVITLFSVSTLPNTLVMGIPLLSAMYGGFTQALMVQLVVLQCIVWYTLLLFLFEYRAATCLVRESFPDSAAAITHIEVDGDVVSLAEADAETDPDGEGGIRVRIRKSTSSSRPSNMSGVEIYSVNTPSINGHDVTSPSPVIGYTVASSDAYSLQPTPRPSDFADADVAVAAPPSVAASAARVFSPAYPGVKMLWEYRNGASTADKSVIREDDISFRSTTKLAPDLEMDGCDDHDVSQAMPRTAVMLRLILTMVGRKLSRNPNTYSSVLGLMWSLISFKWDIEMPSLVKHSISIISDAGLGMAMFSLGLFMALQPRIIACGAKMGATAMAIRFFVGPAVVSAASMVVGLKGAHLHTAIVQAALPQGIVPFVFAREYVLHPDILSTGVIFGMLVSLPVTLLYYILLGL